MLRVSGKGRLHLRGLAALFGCLLLFAFNPQMASAMWAERPPIVWLTSSDGNYEAKWVTKTGDLTVFVLGKRDKPLWVAKLSEYHRIFSDVRLADGGRYIVHIRGNMQAANLGATAVEIVSRGKAPRAPKGMIGLGIPPLITTKAKVKLFIDKLKGLNRAANGMVLHVSDGPQSRWLQQVKTVTDTTLTLSNADGEQKMLDLATGMLVQNKVIIEAGYRLIPITKREHGYNNFPTQLISSSEELKSFKSQVAKHEGWNNKSAFTKALTAAEVDFAKEALMLVRHTEGSGSIPVSLAIPKPVESGLLISNVQRSPLKSGMSGTADMAYYCYALVVSKALVRKIQLQVAGKNTTIIQIAGDGDVHKNDNVRERGAQKAMPAMIPPMQPGE